MPRIVSLIASATEIVCYLGFEDQLVGRSHECDYPESVKRLPVCTAPKIDIHAASGEIDGRIKSILRDGLSVYRVDAEKLRELKPDVVVTQTQCEVCAVSQRDVEAALCDWVDSRPQIVSLAPNTLRDVWNDVARVGEALHDNPWRTRRAVSRLRERSEELARMANTLPDRPTAACIEWIEPLMAAGNWVPELVAMAGGVNLFGEAGKHAPWMTWEQLVAANPDVIALMPCGFDIARTRQEMGPMTERPEWPPLSAVRRKRVFACDGNQYFNRPGPRLVESLRILIELFHPQELNLEPMGRGWERF
jgi:iron complex transport system substrate-binding protein